MRTISRIIDRFANGVIDFFLAFEGVIVDPPTSGEFDE